MKMNANNFVLNRQLSKMIQANEEVKIALQFLLEKYELEGNEVEAMGTVYKHFDNISELFRRMMK